MTWCIAYTSVVQYKIWLPRQQPANIDYNPSARSSRELSDAPVVFLPRLERMPWARAQPVTPDDHSELVPLLPIPNRTVKRLCADDSGRTSVKVGHRQAFIARTPQLTAAGFVFVRTQMLWLLESGQTSAGHRPAPAMARARHEHKRRGRAAGLYVHRCARAGAAIAAACWSPAGDHTPRPRGSLAGMRAAPVYPGCGRYKRHGFAEALTPATSAGLLPLSGARPASDYGTACPGWQPETR